MTGLEIYNKLSIESKAAWASCSLLAHVIEAKGLHRTSDSKVIKILHNIGLAMSTPIGAEKCFSTYYKNAVENLSEIIWIEDVELDDFNTNEYGFTKDELKLLDDVLTSDLLEEICIIICNN